MRPPPIAKFILNQFVKTIDQKSGIIGLNDLCEVVTATVFKQNLDSVCLAQGVRKALTDSATGIVAFDVATTNDRIAPDEKIIKQLALLCEQNDLTLVDFIFFYANEAKTWIGARRMGLL